jgi:hypothetical protein
MKKCSHSIRPLYLGLRFLKPRILLALLSGGLVLFFSFSYEPEDAGNVESWLRYTLTRTGVINNNNVLSSIFFSHSH